MRLAWQIGAGCALAAGVLFALWWFVAGPEPQAEAGSKAATPHLPDDTPPGGRAALDLLHGSAGRFQLGLVRADLPKDCEPVLEIRAGGRISIATPPPLARNPGDVRWPRVGILLPRGALAELTAAERASLLEVWARLSGGRTIGTEEIEVRGCVARVGEVAWLLGWVR